MLTIYEIFCNTTNKRYIGSTVQPLEIRIAVHKASYKAFLAGKQKYYSSFEILNGENYEVNILEEIDDETDINRYNREAYWFNIYENSCVNCNVPSRTANQYYKDNNQRIKKFMNNHYQNNVNGYRDKARERYQAKKQNLIDEALTELTFQLLES